eukprot:CAMPEP_0182448802 /NCGR_PEP_ID=MMETSP1172-20130603/29990_1 /TAXON_ID=708627 /ORGANISM="Timspurckia oligopyrenoides, Strain CCMP3278" /LENGTH=367 /DNA_ID=CAMNT_0024645819 /DNA_START=245 /DNA_END=1348 /DNA_ORIENTATION=+
MERFGDGIGRKRVRIGGNRGWYQGTSGVDFGIHFAVLDCVFNIERNLKQHRQTLEYEENMSKARSSGSSCRQQQQRVRPNASVGDSESAHSEMEQRAEKRRNVMTMLAPKWKRTQQNIESYCALKSFTRFPESEMLCYKITRSELNALKVVGFFGANQFILAVANHCLFVIDQHAADERIRYEKLEDSVVNAKQMHRTMSSDGSRAIYASSFRTVGRFVSSIPLEPPLIVRLEREQAILINKYLDFVELWGWRVSQSDKEFSSFVVHSTLAVFNRPPPNILSSILEFATSLETVSAEQHRKDVIPNCVFDLIASHACRSAIKFGDSLTVSESESLISRLALCRYPFYCAHGRPSIIPLLLFTKQNKN